MTRCILCAHERGQRIPSIRRSGLCSTHVKQLRAGRLGRMLIADLDAMQTEANQRIQAIAHPEEVCQMCHPDRRNATNKSCPMHLEVQRRMLARA